MDDGELSRSAMIFQQHGAPPDQEAKGLKGRETTTDDTTAGYRRIPVT